MPRLLQDPVNREFFVREDGAKVTVSQSGAEDLGDYTITELRAMAKAINAFIAAQPLAPTPNLKDLSDPQIVSLYMSMKGRREEINAVHKAADEKRGTKVDEVKADILRRLNERGVESFSIAGIGSVKRSKLTRVAAGDWGMFWDWFLDQVKKEEAKPLSDPSRNRHAPFAFLYKKLSSTAVTDFMGENGPPPNGVNVNSYFDVSITKPRK